MDEPLPYLDEGFINLVRVAITDEAMRIGRVISLDFCECAAGVVATHNRFFFDPKRWKLGKKKNENAPFVEVRCQDLNDVSDVVACAREQLVALKGDKWREDIYEKAPEPKKKK